MYSVQPQHLSGNVIYGIAFVVSCAFASVFLAIASFVCVRYVLGIYRNNQKRLRESRNNPDN